MLISKPRLVVLEIRQTPRYILEKINSYHNLNKYAIAEIGFLRWSNVDKDKYLQIISRVFYNKLLILADEIFNYLSNFSPRIYFQAGDTSSIASKVVEPIPFFLFPLMLLGLYKRLNKNSFKTLLVLFLLPLIAFLTGQKNLIFLSPVYFYLIFLSAQGFLMIKNKRLRDFLGYFIILYGIYIVLRSFLI